MVDTLALRLAHLEMEILGLDSYSGRGIGGNGETG